MKFPTELKYTKDHQWIKIEGDIATVGITDFAQSELGDIVYIDVETLDEVIKAEEVYGSVEAVKTVSDLFMPVTGEIFELNEDLDDEPELVNTNPYEGGWIIKIKISDDANTQNLLDAESYQKLIK